MILIGLSALLIFNLLTVVRCGQIEIDPNGYVAFCPCMGRFGNQMDQFLGALAFAKGLKRTLVLPHLIEYPDHFSGSVQIPFLTYFKREPLSEYTKVIPMDEFMENIAPKVWPKGKRYAFCYAARFNSNGCNAKEGNPFGPFWDKFGVDFDQDIFYGPLGHDPDFREDSENWLKKYPANEYPVLAFAGAPGAFPVLEKHVPLQKYLKWSDNINKKADSFIDSFRKDKNETLLGIHLRNGVDFERACEHTKNGQGQFFASPQCLGYAGENGKLSQELCYPSEATILKQIGRVIKKLNVKYVYIATDNDDMIPKFKKKFPGVKFIKYNGNSPHVDLCILGKADHAIVNCVSTFSAFVKRQRDSEGKSTEFWAFRTKQVYNENTEEL